MALRGFATGHLKWRGEGRGRKTLVRKIYCPNHQMRWTIPKDYWVNWRITFSAGPPPPAP